MIDLNIIIKKVKKSLNIFYKINCQNLNSESEMKNFFLEMKNFFFRDEDFFLKKKMNDFRYLKLPKSLLIIRHDSRIWSRGNRIELALTLTEKTALTGFEIGFGFSPITQNGGEGWYEITDIRPDPDPPQML